MDTYNINLYRIYNFTIIEDPIQENPRWDKYQWAIGGLENLNFIKVFGHNKKTMKSSKSSGASHSGDWRAPELFEFFST